MMFHAIDFLWRESADVGERGMCDARRFNTWNHKYSDLYKFRDDNNRKNQVVKMCRKKPKELEVSSFSFRIGDKEQLLVG
jgi:hypothetical protein